MWCSPAPLSTPRRLLRRSAAGVGCRPEELMPIRTRVARTAFVAGLALLVAAPAVWAVPPITFTSPLRIGFASGDDWEPSIAADDHGHVYALWTHYVGFEGGDTGEVDPSCPECPSPHMVIQISDDNGVTWGEPHALAPSEERQDDPQIVVDAGDGQTVYAAYMEGNKSSIVVARSDDFGQYVRASGGRRDRAWPGQDRPRRTRRPRLRRLPQPAEDLRVVLPRWRRDLGGRPAGPQHEQQARRFAAVRRGDRLGRERLLRLERGE